LFKISLENFFKVRFYVHLHLHIPPSELDNLDYYEYHYIIKELVEHLKKENEANKSQNEQVGDMSSKMKVPKISIPKMNIPRM